MKAPPRDRVALGLDFGTDSVRAMLLTLDGQEAASAVSTYRHGQLTQSLPHGTTLLEPRDAFQHPSDWLEAAGKATREALSDAALASESVVGIGVDFTSCTVLPTLLDGTPLCLLDALSARKHAWPKLWKHHGALLQCEQLNEQARRRAEPWLTRYGGSVGLEWLWPKLLETYDLDRGVFDRCALFVEAGDWVVWQLIGGARASALIRSTCQAGYKACWSPSQGHVSAAFLNAVRAGFAEAALPLLRGTYRAPGQRAGLLCRSAAELLGLATNTPVSTAIIDAHAAVPGVGAGAPGTLVMVLGTSACHMLNATYPVEIQGVAGCVQDGILEGMTGLEMGQAALGDAFAWLSRVTQRPLSELAHEATTLPAASHGVLCVDWFNGCRTPLMRGDLKASLHGLTLSTSPAHLYRAILEGCAMGCRWIVDLIRQSGVALHRVIATGGLPHRSPIIVQTFSDVLGMPVEVHPSRHASASGAAMLGALASGEENTGFVSVHEAIEAMAHSTLAPVHPRREFADAYDALYSTYRELARSSHLLGGFA